MKVKQKDCGNTITDLRAFAYRLETLKADIRELLKFATDEKLIKQIKLIQSNINQLEVVD